MKYVALAVNVPVRGEFHYYIPPELALEVGQLVRVSFGTAEQPAIVLALHDESPVEQTKPVLELLDPQPVVTQQQIDLAYWISRYYHTPIGLTLWAWLPPGIAGKRTKVYRLLDADVQSDDETVMKIIDSLRKKDRPVGQFKKYPSRVLNTLKQAGVIAEMSVLNPPMVKPRMRDTASLVIHPDRIDDTLRYLGKPSRESDLLTEIYRLTDEDDVPPTVDDLLDIPGIGRRTLEKLLETDLISVDTDEHVLMNFFRQEFDRKVFELRGGEVQQHVLRVLAREEKPVDVSWVYAQTGATLDDLKRLEDRNLIRLGERRDWRDPLAQRDFVPMSPPRLTQGQREVWKVLSAALRMTENTNPLPASPGFGGGVGSPGNVPSPNPGRVRVGSIERWRPDTRLWQKMKPLATQLRADQTPAEQVIWQRIRKKQILNYKFRRQYVIERFIVDFCCLEARLIIEIDGPTHEYTVEEDAIRQEFLESCGFAVLRFTNEEVYDQLEDVIDAIRDYLKRLDSKVFLLHGVTGSGKTEIYLRAIERVLAQGRQAILLVPEIAMTAQTIRRVLARFPNNVAVIDDADEAHSSVGLVHHKLSSGERYDTWQRARVGEVQVVVGTRTALFTPLPDVGLIILDEEHDPSYKQSPGIMRPPYYHTRDVAERMMRDNNGLLLLGSATPDLETYYRAQRGDIQYLHLPERIMGHRVRITEQAEREGVQPHYTVESQDDSDALTMPLPQVEVVDMRVELKAGNTDMFSHALQCALSVVLARGEQAILFMNRRGASTYVFCRDCGYIVQCPRCDTPMTFHQADGAMHCHHCGYHQHTPTACPNCGSARIKYFGAGTQQVEETLKAHFPQARFLRWDADTASNPGAHDLILQRFMDRQADVLIGTQMIAKGLDLPLVTLVGVVSADLGLALPDFRANERSFQLLTQVAGRAGRGLLGGKVILQTYQPEHYAIAAAAKHDYTGFYAQEIEQRRNLGYPPFRRLVRILFQDEKETRVRAMAEDAAAKLSEQIAKYEMTGTQIIGPAPCFFGKINRLYRWQILLRGVDPAAVFNELDIASQWLIDIDPIDLL